MNTVHVKIRKNGLGAVGMTVPNIMDDVNRIQLSQMHRALITCTAIQLDMNNYSTIILATQKPLNQSLRSFFICWFLSMSL